MTQMSRHAKSGMHGRRFAANSVSTAVAFALYGMPNAASAQQVAMSTVPQQSEPSGLQEIVVTATRHEQALESVPYSVSVVSGEEIARAGVTDLVSLAAQVPGLSMYNVGTSASNTVFPIIRGINASAAVLGAFRTFEQTPVGIYIGNSPINGYFQLDDVQRVEVLRGPQGTLYGAGALGGALRIIPNAPELAKFAGNIEVGGGAVAHSSSESYETSAMFNVPIGDTVAFRVSGKYAYEPGFINVYGIIERNGSALSGIPVLADPADPVNSPGIYTGKKDWNDQNTFTGRASLLWKPTDAFNAEFAYTYANVNGDGNPNVNTTFPGGAYPIDPRITFPGTGPYQVFEPEDQPFSDRMSLASLDLSFDAGFATLSSTSSYFTTTGSNQSDETYAYFGLPGTGYYAGNPVNPRFVSPQIFSNNSHTFAEELRLVSATGPDKQFDYVVGLYYENQTREGLWNISNPGTPERAVAEGCTAPYFSGAPFPNCLVLSGPNDIVFTQSDVQRFTDKSEFGELTWHFVKHGQITFGGRHFEQNFTDVQSYVDYAYAITVPPAPHSAPASKNTWKIDPSYEYAAGQFVYALWSQGFRRGGANAIPLTGILGEKNPILQSYVPDSTNNYEAGVKGRFANGLSYAFDVFDVDWNRPQVGGITPIGNFAVWNANKARSTGAEFDLNAPLFLSGLSLTVGGSYENSRFTQDYFIAADIAGNITGKAGQQLPGSPKVSAAATINYAFNLAPDYAALVSLNNTYRSAMLLSTFAVLGGQVDSVPGMDIINLSATVTHGPWHLGAYVTNIADRRIEQVPNTQPPSFAGGLAGDVTINPPREISLRVRYSF